MNQKEEKNDVAVFASLLSRVSELAQVQTHIPSFVCAECVTTQELVETKSRDKNDWLLSSVLLRPSFVGPKRTNNNPVKPTQRHKTGQGLINTSVT